MLNKVNMGLAGANIALGVLMLFSDRPVHALFNLAVGGLLIYIASLAPKEISKDE